MVNLILVYLVATSEKPPPVLICRGVSDVYPSARHSQEGVSAILGKILGAVGCTEYNLLLLSETDVQG